MRTHTHRATSPSRFTLPSTLIAAAPTIQRDAPVAAPLKAANAAARRVYRLKLALAGLVE